MKDMDNPLNVAFHRLPWWRKLLCLFGICDDLYWVYRSAKEHGDMPELVEYLEKYCLSDEETMQ